MEEQRVSQMAQNSWRDILQLSDNRAATVSINGCGCVMMSPSVNEATNAVRINAPLSQAFCFTLIAHSRVSHIIDFFCTKLSLWMPLPPIREAVS